MEHFTTTAEILAAQHGVGPATIRRDGADAALLDQHPEVAAAQKKPHPRLSNVVFSFYPLPLLQPGCSVKLCAGGVGSPTISKSYTRPTRRNPALICERVHDRLTGS